MASDINWPDYISRCGVRLDLAGCGVSDIDLPAMAKALSQAHCKVHADSHLKVVATLQDHSSNLFSLFTKYINWFVDCFDFVWCVCVLCCVVCCCLSQPGALLASLLFATNSIADQGAENLADVLKATVSSITFVDLECNKIGDPGATALAGALKSNGSLKTLSLANNRIGAVGAGALGEALKRNLALSTLDLRYNLLFDAGASGLAIALGTHRSLTDVNLGMVCVNGGRGVKCSVLHRVLLCGGC
jgi:Ran GTPase-activating protein (RanGAP) involved in mRNA processing and transport